MGLSLRGTTSGAIDINAPAVAGDNTITLPGNNGSANQFFKNSGTAGIVTYSSMLESPAGDVGVVGKLEIGPLAGVACTISSAGNISGNSFNAFRPGQGYVYVSGSSVNGLSIYDANNSTILSRLGWDGSAKFGGTDVALDDTGIYLMDGANASASNYRSRVLTDGSAAFGSGAATISASGAIGINRSSASNDIIVGQLNGTDNFKVKASGALDANGRADIGTTSLDDYAVAAFTNSATYGGIYAQNNNANGHLFTGQENSTEVFKVFANGRINSGSPYTSGNGVNIFGGGSIYIRQDGATGGVLRIRNGSDYKIELKGNGDADFAGAVKIGGTAAANQIDEYEEGTFTPTYGTGVTSPNYDIQQGHYVRVGRLVSFSIGIRADGGTPNNSHLVITGMPFTTLNSSNSEGSAMLVYNANIIGSNVTPTFYMPVNTVNIEVYVANGASAWTGNTGNDVMNRVLRIRGQYYTS